MSNKAIGIGLIFAMIVMFWVSVMWSAAQDKPQPFPRPADIGQVRMHFVAGKMTIYAPSDKVATRPGMDSRTTVIEIDTTPAAPVPVKKN